MAQFSVDTRGRIGSQMRRPIYSVLGFVLVSTSAGCPEPPRPKPPPATESTGGSSTDNAEGAADDGTHGPLHKANQGKILFSANRLADDAAEDAALLTEISLGDRVYAKGFFARSPSHQLQRDGAGCGPSASGWIERTVSLDGKVEATIGGPITSDTEYVKQTTANVDLAGIDSERPIIWPDFRESLPIAFDLANVTDGTHTVDIVFGARCRQPKGAIDPLSILAKGSLAIKVTPKLRAAFTASVGPFVGQNIFKSAPDTKAINLAGPKTYTGLFIDFRGLEDDWKVTHQDGKPLVRKLPAIIAIRNPPACSIQGVEIIEDWTTDKWSAPQFQNVKDTRFDPQTVPCSILQAKPPKPK
ncbi:hypothetical protein BH09MYX1_BH09MYX1_04780 [soil metagenome]